MNPRANPAKSHNLLQTIISWFEKLRQQPDIYPIKYYKKNQFRKIPARISSK